MSKTIDIIKLKEYKRNRLKFKSKTESLIAIGVKPETADAHCSDSGVVIRGERELAFEIDRRGLANKAYNKLEEKLQAPKDSDAITSAQALLKYTVGEKQTVITEGDKGILRKYLPDIEL